MTPIFLFSLPRSGSTLVQRILALHPLVSTTAEPWLLLPYFYALRRPGVYAEYAHFGLVQAVEDFCDTLPNGKADYYAEIRELALHLYAKASDPSAVYFVDKTPRYHLIVDEIMEAFPEAKFIFLWRDPLAVVASIIETWGEGRWNLYRYKVDLFTGLENLLSAYERCTDRAYALRYETLLIDPEAECQRLFAYLELQFDGAWLHDLSNLKLKGQMGDPVGVKQYRTVSTAPLEKWKSTLANPIRKAWCRRYLRWIGARRLSLMGYDGETLQRTLAEVPLNFYHVGSDLIALWTSGFRYLCEPHIVKRQIQEMHDWPNLHLHL